MTDQHSIERKPRPLAKTKLFSESTDCTKPATLRCQGENYVDLAGMGCEISPSLPGFAVDIPGELSIGLSFGDELDAMAATRKPVFTTLKGPSRPHGSFG
jgi:hypothetical protein